MFIVCAVGFLLLRLLASSPNQFAQAAPNICPIDDNLFDEKTIDETEQEGIDSKDLMDKPWTYRTGDEDEKQGVRRDDYMQQIEESENQQDPLDSLEQCVPMREDERQKEKRWIWSKKQKSGLNSDKSQSGWVFNTAATEGARPMTNEDQRVLNRVAQMYGAQLPNSGAEQPFVEQQNV